MSVENFEEPKTLGDAVPKGIKIFDFPTTQGNQSAFINAIKAAQDNTGDTKGSVDQMLRGFELGDSVDKQETTRRIVSASNDSTNALRPAETEFKSPTPLIPQGPVRLKNTIGIPGVFSITF